MQRLPTFTDREISMTTVLKGSKTEDNLKQAFAREAQTYCRYLYFASQAEGEGRLEAAALFRSTAEGETGHARGHLEWLEQCGDPVTGLPIGTTRDNLASAVASEAHECNVMYPEMARVAREEGHADVADWFETLSKSEQSHSQRYAKALADWVE